MLGNCRDKALSDSFGPCMEALEPRRMLSVDVALNAGNNFTHSFTDDDGDLVTVVLKNCNAGTLTLPDGGGDAVKLWVDSTSAKATVAINVKKGPGGLGESSLQKLELDGLLKSFKAKAVILAWKHAGDGIATVGGAGYIGDICLKHIVWGADINLPGAGPAVKFAAQYIGQGPTQIVFGSPISSFKIVEWEGPGLLQAPSAKSISTKGGRVWAGGAPIDTSGDLTVDGRFAGDVGSIKVNGDFEGEWVLSRLNKLTAKEWIENCAVLASTSIGSVQCQGMDSAVLFAGVVSPADGNGDGVYDLPDSNDDLLHPPLGQEKSMYFIKSVKVKGDPVWWASYFNSNIAAHTIGSISVCETDTGNGGVPFGAAANFIKKITLKDGPMTIKDSNLDFPEDGFFEDDAVVRLFDPD